MIREYRFFCKDYASESNVSLLSNCRVQHSAAKIRFSSERSKELLKNV